MYYINLYKNVLKKVVCKNSIYYAKSIDSIRKRKFELYIINYLIHGKSYKRT